MPENNTAETGVVPEASEGQSGRGLKLHHLRPAPGAHKAKTRVGRGEASKGKTAGRGTKGTKARGQMPLQRRIPKLKGFSNSGFGTSYQVVNTGRLAELFPEGGDVTPENLVAKGAAPARRWPPRVAAACGCRSVTRSLHCNSQPAVPSTSAS